MHTSTKILLIRHGQTDWNVDRRVMGGRAIPLNETGRAQMEAVRAMLNGLSIDCVYHSPHLRTEESAAILASAHPSTPRVPEAALREIGYGDWEGKTFDDLLAEDAFVHYFSNPEHCLIPNGEPLREVSTRAVGLIDAIAERHAGQTVALVSHADVIKAVLLYYLGLPLADMHRLSIENASISYLHLSAHMNRVMAMNHTPDFSLLLARGPLPRRSAPPQT